MFVELCMVHDWTSPTQIQISVNPDSEYLDHYTTM